MANIQYADKPAQSLPYTPAGWNSDDANEVKNVVNGKVDKVTGQGLSTNDYTTSEKNKLATIAPGATAYTDTQADARIALQKGVSNGLATLDANSKISANQIPSLAIVEFLGSVASQAAMLALSGQPGDWCKRSDTSQVFMLTASDPTLIGSWTVWSYPASNPTWGTIVGTLSAQTDLNTALLSKKPLQRYTKTAHGFSVGWAVKRDSTNVWIRSRGNNSGTSSVVDGIVSKIIDANNFELATQGDFIDITGLGLGLTADTHYYLDDTVSGINYVSTAPTTVGKVYKKIFKTTDTNGVIVLNFEGFEITNASGLADSDYGDFTVASGVATIDPGVITPTKMSAGGTTPDNTKYYRGDGTWQVVSGGGGLSFAETEIPRRLAKGTKTAALQLNFDFSAFTASYKKIWVVVRNLVAAGGGIDCKLATSPDGATANTGTTSYNASYRNYAGFQGPSTGIGPLIFFNLGNAATDKADMYFEVLDPNNATYKNTVYFKALGGSYNLNTQYWDGALTRAAAEAIKGIHLISGSGSNTLACDYEIWGTTN